MNARSIHCPSCGGSDVRQSHTHSLQDGLLRMFGFVAYRCRACRSRFHRRPPDGESDQELVEAQAPEQAPGRETNGDPRR